MTLGNAVLGGLLPESSGDKAFDANSLEIKGGIVKSLLPGCLILVVGGLTIIECKADGTTQVWFLDNTSRNNLGEVLLSYGQYAYYSMTYRTHDVSDSSEMNKKARDAWTFGKAYIKRSLSAATKVRNGAVHLASHMNTARINLMTNRKMAQSPEERKVASAQAAEQEKEHRIKADSWYKMLLSWDDEIAMDIGQLWNMTVAPDIEPVAHAVKVERDVTSPGKVLNKFDAEFLH